MAVDTVGGDEQDGISEAYPYNPRSRALLTTGILVVLFWLVPQVTSLDLLPTQLRGMESSPAGLLTLPVYGYFLVSLSGAVGFAVSLWYIIFAPKNVSQHFNHRV